MSKNKIPKIFKTMFSKYSDWIKFQCIVYSITGMSSHQFKKYIKTASEDDIYELISVVNRKQIKLRKPTDLSPFVGAISRFLDQYNKRKGNCDDTCDQKE